MSFAFGATAAQASFTIGGNLYAFGTPGRVQFEDAATAADASFATLAGANLGGRLSFTGTALDTASARPCVDRQRLALARVGEHGQ